jgi:outer membrane protein assembly factor BamB
MLRKVCGGVVLVMLGASACTTPSSDWWTFQHDAQRTGATRAGMGRNIKPFWNVPVVTGTISLTAPVFGVIRDTARVFIGGGYGDGKLYALSPYTGAQFWSFTAAANTGFFGAPAAADSTVYAATKGTTPYVYALRQTTGALVWQTALPGTGSGASVAVGLGMVFVNTDAHKLYALNQTTGAILWSVNTSPGAGSQESSPSIAFGKVYVGSDDGLFAFDAGNGAQVWKYNLAAIPGFSSAVIDTMSPPLVFIGTNDMKVHAVNANTGAGVWIYNASATMAFSNVAAAHGYVFVFDYNNVVALDRATGAVHWTQASPQNLPRHSSAIASDMLFFHNDTTVFGLSTATGAVVWKGPLPGNGVINAPGSEMGIGLEILLVPNKGHVHAFR